MNQAADHENQKQTETQIPADAKASDSSNNSNPKQDSFFADLSPKRIEAPFFPDRKDALFALFAFVLGFFFIRWVLFSWQGFGVSVFTFAYCGAISLYLVKKGVAIPRASWFWLSATLLCSLSFALFADNGFSGLRALFLLFCAVYWVMSATGTLILRKTGNWMILDGLNGFLAVPFRNFGCQYQSLPVLKTKKGTMGKKIFSIILGILLGLTVTGFVLPLLIAADSGAFSQITNGIYQFFSLLKNETLRIFFDVILGIPTAAYLFGLAAGCVHKRNCDNFKSESIKKSISSLKILPASTIYTLLGLVCLLYVVFIASQLPYFFSAFLGQRPDGWQVYSQYARNGFFELCRIAAINLSLLVGANLLCKKRRQDSLVLKIQNSLLSLLTIILIATAFSKMGLYIIVYGLSIRRLLPCVFMVFLFIVCIGVLALQKWNFSILRFAAVTGAALFTVLCLINADGIVAHYNANRYLAGTLNDFDVLILYQSGPAGVEPALNVYAQTKNEDLKTELEQYLTYQHDKASSSSHKTSDTLQNYLARQKTANFAYPINPSLQLNPDFLSSEYR